MGTTLRQIRRSDEESARRHRPALKDEVIGMCSQERNVSAISSTIPYASTAYNASASPSYPVMTIPNGIFSVAQNAWRRAISRRNAGAPDRCQSTSMCRNAGVAFRIFSSCTADSIAAALENG
jgi:hypothetical protein